MHIETAAGTRRKALHNAFLFSSVWERKRGIKLKMLYFTLRQVLEGAMEGLKVSVNEIVVSLVVR